MFRGFPMVSALSKWHAASLNRRGNGLSAMSNDELDPGSVGILLPALKRVFQFIARFSPLELFKFFDPVLKASTIDV